MILNLIMKQKLLHFFKFQMFFLLFLSNIFKQSINKNLFETLLNLNE